MSTTTARAGIQHELFEAQARRHPAATAVVFRDRSLTYVELDAAANRLAWHLRDLGVAPDVPVGVCLDRSLELAVGLLAVLKAGGACVPLDPSYPAARLDLLLSDAAPAAVLTSAALADRLSGSGPPRLFLDADAGPWAGGSPAPPPALAGPDNVAYVIYTSGSTGRPKGVLLTHRGLANHHLAVVDLYGLGPDDRVLQLCSIGFDASIEEIFPTWSAGATVVLRDDDVPLLGRSWLGWLRSERITVMNLPTAYWHQWARDLHGLGEVVPEPVRLVVVGGEKAKEEAHRTWLRVGGGRSRWVNAYGPTEATCMATTHEPPPGRVDGDPLIGSPLPGLTVKVVDEHGDPVAGGVAGELLIGGAGLARGYLGLPDLTAERFVPDPDGDGARLYRTGDVVRQAAGGDLEFLGRGDDQVKVHGFRVECGEVEAALVGHPDIADAVVLAPEDAQGARRLVAYVVAAGPATAAPELRRFLLSSLPDHMVPSAFTALDSFPLTTHGKLDRKALAALERTGPPAEATVLLLRTATEQRVAAIWVGVLGIDVAGLGPDDDFFELGGHSLLATQVIAQVREAFGTDTPLRAIFESPTVAGLAAAVEADAGERSGRPPALAPVPREPGGRFPLSLAQEQMWALEEAADPPGLYNITALHRFTEPVDEDALRAALTRLVARHETLRTGFAVEAGIPSQVVAAGAPLDLGVSDLSALAPDAREVEALRRTAEQDAIPFDLTSPPLVRAHLLRLGEGGSRLVMTFDHLVCDGTSAGIFMTELAAAYAAVADGRVPVLPELGVQFADFAVWQRRALTEDVLEAQLRWWVERLDGMPPGPAVPFDRLPEAATRRIASSALEVTAGAYQRVHDLARTTQSSVFIVCAAAVQAVLSRHGGMTDIVLSTTMSGRQRAELDDLIGMFAGVGRIRTDLAGDPPFDEVVGRARTSVLGLFEHQDVPFRRVRQAVQPDFPSGGIAVAAALPVELGYFHTPGGRDAEQELFFRGQLHPLSITLLDDGDRIRGDLSYKMDFYDEATITRLSGDLASVLRAVGTNPSSRLSQLPPGP